MFYFLKGTVEELGADFVALEVNGVGYQIFCSSRTLATLTKDTAVKLYIHNHIREDAFTLFGFADNAERSTFEMLTTVKGVGAKVGLALLSALSTADIVNAITMQDGKMFTTASGVGPKLGERIAMELKSKIGSFPVGANANGATVTAVPTGSVAADVISALSNMGYRPDATRSAITNALKAYPNADFNQLFKATLQELR